jgi:hypothetical protein
MPVLVTGIDEFSAGFGPSEAKKSRGWSARRAETARLFA